MNKVREFNHSLRKTVDFFRFLDKVTKCCGCGRIFWDCYCPRCAVRISEGKK